MPHGTWTPGSEGRGAGAASIGHIGLVGTWVAPRGCVCLNKGRPSNWGALGYSGTSSNCSLSWKDGDNDNFKAYLLGRLNGVSASATRVVSDLEPSTLYHVSAELSTDENDHEPDNTLTITLGGSSFTIEQTDQLKGAIQKSNGIQYRRFVKSEITTDAGGSLEIPLSAQNNGKYCSYFNACVVSAIYLVPDSSDDWMNYGFEYCHQDAQYIATIDGVDYLLEAEPYGRPCRWIYEGNDIFTLIILHNSSYYTYFTEDAPWMLSVGYGEGVIDHTSRVDMDNNAPSPIGSYADLDDGSSVEITTV